MKHKTRYERVKEQSQLKGFVFGIVTTIVVAMLLNLI